MHENWGNDPRQCQSQSRGDGSIAADTANGDRAAAWAALEATYSAGFEQGYADRLAGLVEPDDGGAPANEPWWTCWMRAYLDGWIAAAYQLGEAPCPKVRAELSAEET